MALLLAGLPGRGRRPDRQSAVRLRAPGDQHRRPRDRGRRRRRVHRRRRRVDDPRAVRPAQARGGLGSRQPRDWSTRPSAGVSSTRAWPSCTTRTRWARPPRTSPSGGASRASARTRSRSSSQQRAVAAIEAGRFDDQIVPITVPQRKGEPIVVTATSTRAPTRSLEALARAPTGVQPEGGTVTAGNARGSTTARRRSCSSRRSGAAQLGLQPLARVVVDRGRRRRSGGHGHRARPGHAQGARPGRDRRRRPRPRRAQRGVRLPVDRRASTSSGSIRPRSTSTAARSPSAIRSG